MATGPAARLVICAVCFLAATVVDAKGLPPVSPADFQDSERHGAADAADVTSYGVDALAYDVTIEMDVTATLDQRFDTKSIIRVKAKEATDVIVFNVKNIEVNQKVTVDERSTSFSVRIPVNGVEQDAAREQVAIYLDRPLVAGDEYDVTISGVGVEQNPSGRGLVRLNYDDNGRKSFMSAIRSSAKSGRTIFPCVDLPDVEADITLRVSRPSTHLAVSNARLGKSEAISSYFKDTFETVRLSPSQVGLVVAPTHSASSSLDGGVVSAYGRSEASAALREVATTIASLDVVVANLSGLPLALEQLTVVALPGATDVAANAGLLALDEVDVLSLTSGSPASARRDALLALSEAVGQPAVRAAALPRRWADAWAPRGLAAHLRHRYGDQVASGWRLAEQQMVLQLQDVLEEGARTTDTALPDRGSDVTQIGRAAVDKAAVLLRMLEVAFGSTRFGTAAQHYYKKSADGALEIDDLYDVFADEMYNEDLGGLPTTVPIVLSTWTSQPGYPVVTVVRDYENGKMTVSQKKFSWDASSESDAEGVQWWLPISWSYGEIAAYGLDAKPLYMDWMAPGENDVELEMPYVKSYDWIYFNLQQSGLYRVNYDVFNWLMLIKTLRSVRFDEVMAPTTRAHLLGDALALARAGELDYALALELATYVKQESDLVPWLAARRAFAFLEARLPKSSALKQLTAKLLRSRYLDAQFELDGSTSAPDASLLRELVVTWACQAGLQQCRDHAMELYRSWRVDNKAVKPDFVEATLCVGLAESDVDALPFLLELLARAETVGGIRRSLVRAARCAARQDVVQKLVQAAMDKDGAFLSSEVVQLLMAVTDDNPYGWDVVIEYLREGKNYNDLLARMGSPEDTKTLIFHLTSKISSQNELNQLVDAVRWLSTGEDASLLDSIKQTSAPQIAWLERYEDDINDWIRVYLETADNPTTPSTTSPSTTSPSTSTPTRAPTSTTSRAPTSTTSRATTSTPSRAPTSTSTRAPTSTTTTPRTNPPTTASSTSTSTPNYASTTETPSHASALKLPTTLTLLLLVTACRHWF